jgi:lysophospholipase L1-like esterase
MASLKSKKPLQVVLFGDSLTEWAFEEENHGFGWYLQDWYKENVEIVNEGMCSKH